ncbi:RIP metalloprotease RseP [Aliiroseovarius sp.]|uniref:RIP metalloprotease RseP n=1 Tax=Aliiroseovarius sp. TaxID=1872442 RepID=UPI00261647E1|nr:RIP metalloprotease RseP [Aliiroseovarius sp.]
MDLNGFLSSFGNAGFIAVAFVVALSIIVTVHEYGHYIVGRWSGIRADVFSLGFGPVLIRRTDKRGTVWQVAAIPLGGYVKFHGDSNAASGKGDEEELAEMSAQELRTTLHGAPLWARAATVLAGPVFNFILSAIVFAGFLLVQGVPTNYGLVAEVAELPGVETTLQPGDQILEIAGVPIPEDEAFGEYLESLPEQSMLPYLVRRDGQVIELTAYHPRPALVGFLSQAGAAERAGIQVGDLITVANGNPMATFGSLQDVVVNGAGAPVALELRRGDETVALTLTPEARDEPDPDGGFRTVWRIGVGGDLLFAPGPRPAGIGESLAFGVTQTGEIISTSLSGLWAMISGQIGTCNISGPIGIAKVAGGAAERGISDFIWMVAVISTAIGLLNLFPIPVLDGGHLVFHAFEAITGRPPSDRALNILMTGGLILVLSLMIFGLSNDLFC